MDRGTWDWPRLVNHADDLLSSVVPKVARESGLPVNMRVLRRDGTSSQPPTIEGEQKEFLTFPRTFSFDMNGWFERHEGEIEPRDIAEYINKLDKQQGSWVDVYFSRDLSPKEADGLSASEVATILSTFDPIRERLRR